MLVVRRLTGTSGGVTSVASGVVCEREINWTDPDRREVFENCILRTPIKKVSSRRLNTFPRGIQFLNRDDPFRVPVRQAPQQNTIDDTEDRSAGPNTKRERNHHNPREPRMLEQPPHAITNVFDD